MSSTASCWAQPISLDKTGPIVPKAIDKRQGKFNNEVRRQAIVAANTMHRKPRRYVLTLGCRPGRRFTHFTNSGVGVTR
ncbi:hypothetical protein CI1B_30190 [Bradyrhizobium ivorense]|uniref:Uncharacterized protein n=1 Tax=Bradyrhizobium ivorense TaxID=2511166 RepID=A0A508T859_9BRAD|nr:hypothetical protein CI41S_21460 [Bradyrhizobium ivorense]VIO70366.1 hypothetical protein CI1B_30190 [Bradyrhizobium ivorense]